MKNELTARLALLAAHRQTISYGALAKELTIAGPGAIAKLTLALEQLMQIDAAAHQPFRAALVVGRLNNDLPAAGFFQKARALGVYHDTDPVEFVRNQRDALWRQDGS